MKKDYKCNDCGEEIMQDAWAVWDADSQDYVLHSVFDYQWCKECTTEPVIREIELDG